MNITVVGQAPFDDIDARNIPVSVSLVEIDGQYELRADNYMPFKDRIDQWYYGVCSSDPEILRRIVAEKIVPLYEVSLESLKRIATGADDSQVWYPATR